MNNEGFIVLHRKLLEWKYAQFPAAVTLWVHLIMMANWKDGYFLGELIERGSLATSIGALAEQTGLSESTVRRWLRKFEKDGQISRKVTNRFTLIKVANYAAFQDISPQGVNNQMTGQMTGQVTGQMTPNRTKKQSNKETNKRVGRSAPSLREISDFIGEEGLNVDPPKFWKYYTDWGKPFPRDWRNRCRKWSETERPHTNSEPIVIEGPEWLKYTNVEYDPDKIDF